MITMVLRSRRLGIPVHTPDVYILALGSSRDSDVKSHEILPEGRIGGVARKARYRLAATGHGCRCHVSADGCAGAAALPQVMQSLPAPSSRLTSATRGHSLATLESARS
jgi:hypothetical protein